MKRLWCSVALLVLLFGAALANTFYLSAFTLELTELLTQAQQYGEAGSWEQALTLTQQAKARWEARSTYLHTTLRHADIDNVYLFLLQTEQFLDRQESGEYSAANAALLGHLTLLREQEELTLENIL